MCRLCDPKKPQLPCPTRRDFLTASAIGGAAATLGLGSTRTAQAQTVAASTLPEGLGTPGRRVLIKGGAVLSVDDAVGNFAVGDVLIDGKTIVEVGANIDAPDAVQIDAAGKIVMPGFIDTHHHQFETALRSHLANGISSMTAARRTPPTTTRRSFRASPWSTAPRMSTSTSCSAASHSSMPA
jgi:5-methylthioadenosine/S-adenosylhomocysteine deaminase